MSDEGDGGISRMNLIAIFSIFFMTMGYTVVTPAMATLEQAFPGQPYTMISTLPNLFIVLASVLVGSVAGKRVKFRTLAIVGSFLTLVGGCGPAFLDDFYAVLACRAVFGFGLGLTIPLANALVIGSYEGDRQSALLGYGSMFMKAGGIVLQMLGGVLAEQGWQMTFYAYLLYIASLVLAFFIPEPRRSTAKVGADAVKTRLPYVVWVIALLMLAYNMMHFLLMVNVSSIFVDRDVGGAAVAATALSINSIVGCFAGLAFGKFFSRTKRMWLPLLYGVSAVGSFLLASSDSAVLMTVGICMCGCGFGVCIPTFMAWVSRVSDDTNFVRGTSLTSAFLYLGGFLASYWLALVTGVFGDGLYAPLWIECAVCIALMAVFLLFNPFKEVKKTEVAA